MKSVSECDGGIAICVEDPKPTKNREGGHRSKGTVLKEKLEWESANHEAKIWWNTFFIISCAYAVFNDPFFCYINAIDSANKCITTDSKLALIYIYTRTVTDVIYLIDLLISKCRCCCCCCCGRTRKRYQSCFPNLLSTLSRIYVCLPIAQILVSMMIDSLEPNSSNFLFFLSLQYTLRIYYIYGSLKRRSMINIAQVERWIRPILGFVPFILAAYLFGAFWYLLATQRQIKCWLEKRDQIRAELYNNGTYVPVSSTDSKIKGYVACYARQPNITYDVRYNISRWDDLCPVKDSDPKTFDFGIYFYALQSDVASSSKPLLQRVFQSFWWALRNMSSFGSNLNSSMDTLEIFFSALISISGMALFLVYLNARVQESKERSKKLLLEEKKQSMKPDIDLWLSKNNLPEDIETEVTEKKKTKKNLKTVIMDNIHKLDETSTALDMQNILSILPTKYKQRIMCFLFFASAKKAPVFENIEEKVWKAICQYLVPVTYAEDSYIVQEGKPLGKLLLFTQGSAFTYSHGGTSSTAGSSSNKQLWLKKGDFYGDQLIHWAFRSPQNMVLPISTENVVAQEKVEAFAIRASDLKTIFLQFWWLFSKDVHGSQLEQWKHVAATSVAATWRHRQEAKRRLLKASCAKPKRWFRRHVNTKGWSVFDVEY